MKCLLISFTLTLCFLRVLSQDLLDYDHRYNYTKHLINNSRFDEALNELEHLKKIGPINDSIGSLILFSSITTKQYKRGNKLIGEYCFEQENHRKNHFKVKTLSKDTFNPLMDACVFGNDFDELNNAYHTFNKTWGKHKVIDISGFDKEAFKSTLEFLSSHKTKSPVIATVASLVPGLGKFYCNRKHDGLTSFLIIATSGLLSYRMFYLGGIGSAPGWCYGLISLGFYTGNIYGGFKAAKLYNQKLKEQYLELFEREYINYNP